MKSNIFKMICSNYENLSPQERIEFTGKLLHAVMNDNKLKHAADGIIAIAEAKGMFEGVVINPPLHTEEDLIKKPIDHHSTGFYS